MEKDVGGRPCYLDAQDEKGNFTNEKVINFFTALSNGATIEIASGYAEISEPVIYEYIKLGKKDYNNNLDTKYSRFLKLLKKKQQDCKLKCLLDILKNKDWKSKAWYLERIDKSFRLDKEDTNADDKTVNVILSTKKGKDDNGDNNK